jgi:hypothetical protein
LTIRNFATFKILSGTKNAEEIQNLQYAFVMVEKGDDPEGILMEEGVFRVFKDGDEISYYTSWPTEEIRADKWVPADKRLYNVKSRLVK